MIWNGLHRGIERLDALMFPPRCRLCGAATGVGDGLCGGCLTDLPWLVCGCPRCAWPLPDGPSVQLCGACLRKPPAFDAATALLRYHPPVDYLIQRLKFSGELAIAPLLARQLTRKIAERTDPLPELLIPVPLHYTRLRERGFNQSTELARQLSRWLRIPVQHKLCRRIRFTPPQSLAPPAARRRNLHRAFRVEGRLCAEHVAIIDDVLTTGHTASELAGVLRQAGARFVEVWIIARSGR
jgi:ComF family protein